jgi:hypothetical protein
LALIGLKIPARVGGSIPSLGTSIIKGLAVMSLTPFFLGCGL